jgi:4-hydroxy-tetrahydrodipicolinate reductase
MNIAIIGYGKMGKEIASLLAQIPSVSSFLIDNEEDWNKQNDALSNCDVAIEFSTPATVVQNLKRCIEKRIPVVTGTTDWGQYRAKIFELAKKNHTSLIYGSNFSIGANLFFELNKLLAQKIKEQPQYSVSIEEIHHTQKKDKPSGTAVTIAETILHETENITQWHLDDASTHSNSIPIRAQRIGDIFGTHKVLWESEVDSIELIHTAHNRSGFAQGAIKAALWLVANPGIFKFEDIYKQV